jgi:HK97 family phage prohead protease
MSLERRSFTGDVEIRAKGDTFTAYGYAARFNTLSQNLGGFVEMVAPGTFTKTVKEADIRGLFNHDANFPLGRLKAGTLRLWEDDEGLAYELDLPNSPLGHNVAESLRRHDVTGSSFGFRTIEDEWGETGDGFPLRTLKAVALRDVGPVTFPAYTSADSALRSLAEKRNLDINVLVAAAERNELRSALIVVDENSEPTDQEDGRETLTVPVFHRFVP